MTMVQAIDTGSDRVVAHLVAGLEAQFGRGAGRALAQRFLEAEEGDYLWEARSGERWLGQWLGMECADIDLDRVAIIGRWDGRWFVAVLLVDGQGDAHGLIGRRFWQSRARARAAYQAAQ
jgi:hypothetical protein